MSETNTSDFSEKQAQLDQLLTAGDEIIRDCLEEVGQAFKAKTFRGVIDGVPVMLVGELRDNKRKTDCTISDRSEMGHQTRIQTDRDEVIVSQSTGAEGYGDDKTGWIRVKGETTADKLRQLPREHLLMLMFASERTRESQRGGRVARVLNWFSRPHQ